MRRKLTWKCGVCGMVQRKEPHRSLSEHMSTAHNMAWSESSNAYAYPPSAMTANKLVDEWLERKYPMYHYLQKDEIIQVGDECDNCNDGWRDEPVWVPAKAIGEPAPDPGYPAHRRYRRRLPIMGCTIQPTQIPPSFSVALRSVIDNEDSLQYAISLVQKGTWRVVTEQEMEKENFEDSPWHHNEVRNA